MQVAKYLPVLGLLLAVSHGSGTSGVTELRKQKRKLHNFSQRKEGNHVRRMFLLILREGEAGDAPSTRAEVALQPGVQPIVRKLYPCSPWRRPHWSRGMPKGGCDPVGVTIEQPVPEGRSPWKEIHAVAVPEELQPKGKTHTVSSSCRIVPWGKDLKFSH